MMRTASAGLAAARQGSAAMAGSTPGGPPPPSDTAPSRAARPSALVSTSALACRNHCDSGSGASATTSPSSARFCAASRRIIQSAGKPSTEQYASRRSLAFTRKAALPEGAAAGGRVREGEGVGEGRMSAASV